MAGGVRRVNLMWAADNGRNAGPLVVQDTPSDADLQQLIRSVKDSNSFVSNAPLADAPERPLTFLPAIPIRRHGRPVHRGGSAGFRDSLGPVPLGALTARLYYLFAQAIRSLAVGTLAGVFSLHPFWVVDTAAINDGTLASFLVGLSLFVGDTRWTDRRPVRQPALRPCLGRRRLRARRCCRLRFFALAWYVLRRRRMPSGWLRVALISRFRYRLGAVDHP